MTFFNSAVDVLQTLVIALGAGLGIWGVINLLEGYGNDNPGAILMYGREAMQNYRRTAISPCSVKCARWKSPQKSAIIF